MIGWSIEAGGVEKSFADLEIGDPILKLVSNGIDMLTFVAKGRDFDSNEIFSWGSSIILRYSGVKRFVGIVTGIPRSGSGESENQTVEVSGPWYYLQETQFQQSWKDYSSGVALDKYTSHLILNAGPNLTLAKLRDQIAAIIQYAIDQGRPIAIGTILENYDLYAPWDEIRETPCADCIMKELRWVPDAVVYWDYTATVPTLHVRRRSVLDVDTVQYGPGVLDGFETVKQIDIKERTDLLRPAVVISYEVKVTVDGKERFGVITDKWPVTATGRELRAVNLTIEVNGPSTKTVKANLTSDHLDILDGNTAAQMAWLKAKIPALASPKVQNIQLLSVVRDLNSLGLMQELVKGQIAPWMGVGNNPILGQKDAILIKVNFELLNDSNETAWSMKNQEFSFKFTGTNSAPGLVSYQSLESVDSGDPIPATGPAGLARFLYENLQQIQFDGTMLVKEQEVGSIGRPGKVINVLGGMTSWTTAKMLVQSKTENLETGESVITVGPANHLGVQDIMGLLKVSRPRRRWTAAKTQFDGSASSGSSVVLGHETANTDTASAGQVPAKMLMKQDASFLLNFDPAEPYLIYQGIRHNLWESGGGEAIWLP